MSVAFVTLMIDKKTKAVVSQTPDKVDIDLNAFPKHIQDTLCRVVLKSTAEYFKRPGVQAEYEQWLAERKEISATDGK